MIYLYFCHAKHKIFYMKKLFLFICFTMIAVVSYGQYNNDGLYYIKPKTIEKPSQDLYNTCIRKAANFDYAALGSGAVSAGLFVGYAAMKDKFKVDKNGEVSMSNKAKGLLISGGIMGFISIILKAESIQYRLKAGKNITLKSSDDGASLYFNF